MGNDDDDFVRSLNRLVADARAEQAASDRAKVRVLRQVAEEEATFAGVALDLCERGVPIIARTTAGRAHRGHIIAVGRDFLAVRDERRPPTLLAFSGVAALRPQPGASVADSSGSRPTPLDISLVTVLARIAVERPRVQFVAPGDEPIAGELSSVGQDIATLRLTGDRQAVVYVRIATLAEVVLLD